MEEITIKITNFHEDLIDNINDIVKNKPIYLNNIILRSKKSQELLILKEIRQEYNVPYLIYYDTDGEEHKDMLKLYSIDEIYDMFL